MSLEQQKAIIQVYEWTWMCPHCKADNFTKNDVMWTEDGYTTPQKCSECGKVSEVKEPF